MYKFMAIAGCVLVVLAIVALSLVGVINTEIELRNGVKAQAQKNTASFDTMWKILQQKAGITEQYKGDFKEIWSDIIRGRYEKGNGQLMTWIQERNPSFDSSLYKDLSSSVEAERKRFLRDQESLIQKNTERNNYIQKPITKWVLTNFGGELSAQEIEIKIITSEKTDEVFEKGQENDVDLFNKKAGK